MKKLIIGPHRLDYREHVDVDGVDVPAIEALGDPQTLVDAAALFADLAGEVWLEAVETAQRGGRPAAFDRHEGDVRMRVAIHGRTLVVVGVRRCRASREVKDFERDCARRFEEIEW